MPTWKASESPWSLTFYGSVQEELQTLASPIIQTPLVRIQSPLNTFRAEPVAWLFLFRLSGKKLDVLANLECTCQIDIELKHGLCQEHATFA